MNDSSNSKWSIILFSGILSLIVGVASGYGVNWLSEKKAELSYDITAIQAFPGQEPVGIVALKIINSGKKELENIDANLRFSDAEVKEVIFQGLTPQSTSKDKNSLRFQIPFLNPTENFSVQILVSPNSETLQKPLVDLRAKGAIGIPFTQDETEKNKGTLTIFVAVLATLLTLFSAIKLKSGDKFDQGKKHSGDQRDLYAFVLSNCKLSHEAELIRAWPRDLSFWSASDILTEHWLQNIDRNTILSGITAFNELINYAEVAPSSVRILQLNAARLCLALNDIQLTRKYLADATSVKDLTISNRIKMLPSLSQLS